MFVRITESQLKYLLESNYKNLILELGEASSFVPYEILEAKNGYVAYFKVKNKKGEVDRIKVDIDYDYVDQIYYEKIGCANPNESIKVVNASFRTAKFDDMWTIQPTNFGEPYLVLGTVFKIFEEVKKIEPNIVQIKYETIGDMSEVRKYFYQKYFKKLLEKPNFSDFLLYEKDNHYGIIRKDFKECLN